MVICLERGADLHMAQLMPLLLTVSCFSKIQIGLPFWYRLTRIFPEKGPLNGCVCVLVNYCQGSLLRHLAHPEVISERRVVQQQLIMHVCVDCYRPLLVLAFLFTSTSGCLQAYDKTGVQSPNFTKFPVHVAWSFAWDSSDSCLIRYIRSVLWWTSCLLRQR